MFGGGSHISPHDHRVYWGVWPLGYSGRQQEEIEHPLGKKRQVAERVLLYAPADLFYIDVGKGTRSTPEGETYVEWGGSFGTCDGHRIGLGHIAEPSPELIAIRDDEEMECDGLICRWKFRGFIPAGMPIFKSRGYTGAFDFALVFARPHRRRGIETTWIWLLHNALESFGRQRGMPWGVFSRTD